MSKSGVTKPAPKCKKEEDAIKSAFSRKMKLLEELCADQSVTDGQFRVLFALLAKYHRNETELCNPRDEILGESCAKSERTARRLTKQLKRGGILTKKKQLGASTYSFPGLNQDRPTLAGLNELRPANLGTKTGQVGYQDRPPVGRTEPPIEPPIEPLSEDASPSPLNEASASSNGCRSSLDSQTPKAELNPLSPGSARPPFPPLGRHMGKTNLSKEEQAAAAVETALARQTIYSELLEWSGLESALSDATAAELRRKGSGAELIVNRYKQRMAI